MTEEEKQNSVEDNQILHFAACFNGDISIDWIIELTGFKPSTVLKSLENFFSLQILKKIDIDRLSFNDLKKKKTILESIPPHKKTDLNRQIVELLWKEGLNEPKIIDEVAELLLQYPNNLEKCSRLLEVAEYYQLNGPSSKSLECYNKVIHDLGFIDSDQKDPIFIKASLGLAFDQSVLNHPHNMITLLKRALKKANKLNNRVLQARVWFALNAYEWFAGNDDNAHECYQMALSLAEGIEDIELERIKIITNILHHFFCGRFNEAVKLYETHEPVFLQKYPKQRIPLQTSFYLGFAYCFIGQVSQGRGLLENLRTQALKVKAENTYAGASCAIGASFLFVNDFERAINHLTSVLSETEESSLFALSLLFSFLAYALFKLGRNSESKRYLEKALTIVANQSYNHVSFFGFIFEIAYAIDKGKFTQVNDIDLNERIANAIKSKNIFIKGVACRFTAILQKSTTGSDVRLAEYLHQSLELLRNSGNQYEIAQTQIELGTYYQKIGEMDNAKQATIDAARLLYPNGEKLIPAHLKGLVDFITVHDSRFDKILNLGQRMLSARDSHEVVQFIFSTINQITGAERAAVFLKSDFETSQKIELWAAKNLTPEDINNPDFSISMDAISSSMRTGKMQIYKMGLDKSIEDGAELTIKSYICLPLVFKGKVIGSLYHDNRVKGNTYEEQDHKLLAYFASTAAIVLDNAMAYEKISRLNKKLIEEKQYYRIQHQEALHLDDFIVSSDVMKEVQSLVKQVANTDSTVLITGETGVGKEVVARSIHQLCSRSGKPFISLNCGAVPTNLVSSELFGHEKGAFTGAINQRAGRFELADGGTLFLDEIGEMLPDLQIQLLRVLETKKFERIGGKETLSSDFRLIAATNRNLEKDIGEDRFRSDLFYRLNVFPIHVPPLRKRKNDILPLAEYFLNIFAKKMNKPFKGISKDKTRELLNYDWPGNVRELENIIERSVILNDGDILNVLTLQSKMINNSTDQDNLENKEDERKKIQKALEKTNWKIYGPDGAAELLGISRGTLYNRMKKLRINKKSRY